MYQNNPGRIEKEAVAMPADSEMIISPAALAFHKLLFEKRKQGYERNDRNEFDARYADPAYYYTNKKNQLIKNPKKVSGSVLKSNSHFSLEKVYRKKKLVGFRIKRNDRSKNNPEMRAFSGVVWATTDNVKARELRTLFRRRSGIHDMRVYQEGNGFVLEFKTVNGFQRINATPARMQRDTLLEYSERMQSTMFRSYSKMLNRRSKQMERSIKRDERNEQRWFTNVTNDSIAAWNKAAPQMNADEKSMDFDSWANYFAKEKRKIILKEMQNSFSSIQVTEGSSGKGTVQANLLYQALTISGFGIYNCDHCGELPDPVSVDAVFAVNGQDKRINPSNVYVIDREINTSTNFFKQNRKGMSITYNGPGRNALIIIDNSGQLAYVDEKSFDTAEQKGGQTIFQAVLISSIPASPAQLRDLLLGAENE